jgi:hypothetical protein
MHLVQRVVSSIGLLDIWWAADHTLPAVTLLSAVRRKLGALWIVAWTARDA